MRSQIRELDLHGRTDAADVEAVKFEKPLDNKALKVIKGLVVRALVHVLHGVLVLSHVLGPALDNTHPHFHLCELKNGATNFLACSLSLRLKLPCLREVPVISLPTFLDVVIFGECAEEGVVPACDLLPVTGYIGADCSTGKETGLTPRHVTL